MWTRTWFGAFVEAAVWFLLAVILLCNVPAWAFNLVDQWLGASTLGPFKPPTGCFYGDLVAGIISGGTLTIYVGLGLARVHWGQQNERELSRRGVANS